MNHSITVGGLLLFLVACCGLLAVVIGVVIFFAGAYGDETGESGMGGTGCLVALGGVVAFGLCLWGLL